MPKQFNSDHLLGWNIEQVKLLEEEYLVGC